MKKLSTLLIFLMALLTMNGQLASAEETWRKYPDNSGKNFQNVDSFYDSIDKKWYEEFENAKLNIREKTYFKDVNTVLSKSDEYGKVRIGGNGYHSERQVYVFVTVSEDGKEMLTAVYDAESQRLISWSSEPERERPSSS